MINHLNKAMGYFQDALARSETLEALARKKTAGSYRNALALHLRLCIDCQKHQSMCIVGEALAAGAAKEVAKGL